MKRYDSYKDSGVEWIGEIPSQWKHTKMKYVGTYINGYPFKPSDWGDNGRLIIRIQNLTKGKGSENFYDNEIDPKYIIKKGDYLFSWSTTLGLFEWKREEGVLNQHIFKVELNEILVRRFYYWVIQGVIEELSNESHGSTMTHLTKDVFGNIKLPLPPLSEQQQIVSFLDTKTLLIDSLIEKTQLKIELLKEKRTSLINEVVTKGLNPNVEMKDSGVEWIGEIPDGWRIVPLRHLGSFQNGISKGSEFFGTGYPFMSYGDVYKNDITPTKLNGKVQLEDSEIDRYTIQRGDVFFTRTSETKDDIGVCSTCLNTIENSGFSGFVIRFRFHNNVHLPEYSRYHFQTHWKKVIIESKMNIVTRSSLSQQVLGDTPVLIPDVNEQQQIVSYLDEQTKLIDNTISIEEKRIELLKEYRQSLISEVVTGKRKVV